jgi:hypothetical protein
MSKTKSVEKEKIVAERLNGRFAMIGFIAAVWSLFNNWSNHTWIRLI